MVINKRHILIPRSSVAPSIIATALAMSFAFAILTLWVPAYWPVSVFETLVFTLAAVVLFHGRDELRLPRYPLLVFAFAVSWGILQIAFGESVYAFATEESLLRWTTFLAIYLIGAFIFQRGEILDRFRAGMVWFGGIIALIAIVQSFVSPGLIFGIFPSGYAANASVMGPILYHGHFAAFVETILPIAVYGALTDKRKSQMYAAASAALYASVIVSASRAGFIIATSEIMVVLMIHYFGRKAGRRIDRFAVLRLLAAAVAFLLVVGWGALSRHLADPHPMAGRLQFAISSLHMIEARPWIGFGLGTWPTVYPQFAVIDLGNVFVNQAHSDWLQWGAEGGLPLLLAMASLFAWLVRPAFRSIWGVGVVAVFVHALFDYPFSRPALGAWPILVLAMVAVSESKRNRTARDLARFRKSDGAAAKVAFNVDENVVR